MQLIARGQNNTVVLTLTERVTLTSPYFLVRVKSRRTDVVKRFILATNLSSSTERYDEFVITENTTENLTSGTVSLTGGDWWYKVYEQASATNLNELLASTMLEEGIFRVIDNNEQGQDTYTDPGLTDTYIDV